MTPSLPKLGYFLRPISTSSTIKNTVSMEPLDGLYPAFSASGQDVWTPYFDFEGDALILSAVGAQSGKTFEATGRWGCVANTTGFALYRDANRRFFWYLTNLPNFWERGGAAQPYVKVSESLRLRIDLPSPEEQRAIAAFLDGKCAKVDEAVRIKEEQIALLRERRQILIQQAVTRGLNPAAPMKDSGIDWIGHIPAHWEVKRLKHLGNAVIGLTYDPKDLCDEDEGTLVLRSSNLKSGKFVYGDGLNAYVRMRIPEKLRIRANDILICSRNGSRDLIGKCALATHYDTGASFGAFTTVFRSEMNRYIFQILNSEIFRMLAGSFLTATINQLTTSNLNSISVPIPPPEERQALTEHLEGLNAEYDRAISFKEDQIAALKEYKTSLINAAVTGKIKVA